MRDSKTREPDDFSARRKRKTLLLYLGGSPSRAFEREEGVSVGLSVGLSAGLMVTRFLDAPTHLYKRVCPLVGLSVGRSVGLLVSRSRFR